MSTNTSVVSFSCDLETLLYMDGYAKEKGGLTRSQVIRYHIRMGRVYLKLMEEQIKQAEKKLVVDMTGRDSDIV